MIIRKIFLLSLIFVFSFSSFSQSLKNKDHSVTNAIKKLQNDKDMANAGISFYAIDLKTGEVIAELNPDLCLKPASTMKIITTAAALEELGATYRFETKIRYDGYIDTITRTLHGNIIIEGGGDPTLGSKYFQSTKNKTFLNDWSKAIKDMGIDTINGYIIGDATKYSWEMIPPTWSWEDFGNYFGAGPCGLSIYDNMYTLYFNTSSTVGGNTTITKVEPLIQGMTFDNQVVSAAISDDQSYIFGTPYTYHRLINGKLPRDKTDYEVKGSMPDPALFAAQELFVKLINDGIIIKKEPTTYRLLKEIKLTQSKKTTLHTTYSPTLAEIIYIVNNNSMNLFAEHLLVEIGIKRGKVNDVKSSTGELEKFWLSKGMNTGGLSVNDGSGLSHYNYASAKQLVYVLQFMKQKSTNYDAFYNSLSIAGERGTLRRFCQNTAAHGKVFAKSGSIRKVRCYAGYTTSKSGREIAFAIMLNNYNCTATQSRQRLEEIVISLVLLEL